MDTAVSKNIETSTNTDTAEAVEQIQLWMMRRRDEETEGRGRRRSGDKSVRLTAVMPAHYLRAGSENLVQEHDAMSDALLRRVEQDRPREIAGQGSGKETTGGRVAEQRKSCLELREM